mmetsp:Transcript_135924/g.247219  ORF Transcript_135924/g.247219 Transcript_135924/m.247219 type:complete len:271 (+) Transcript_135924:36-848(+)
MPLSLKSVLDDLLSTKPACILPYLKFHGGTFSQLLKVANVILAAKDPPPMLGRLLMVERFQRPNPAKLALPLFYGSRNGRLGYACSWQQVAWAFAFSLLPLAFALDNGTFCQPALGHTNWRFSVAFANWRRRCFSPAFAEWRCFSIAFANWFRSRMQELTGFTFRTPTLCKKLACYCLHRRCQNLRGRSLPSRCWLPCSFNTFMNESACISLCALTKGPEFAGHRLVIWGRGSFSSWMYEGAGITLGALPKCKEFAWGCLKVWHCSLWSE